MRPAARPSRPRSHRWGWPPGVVGRAPKRSREVRRSTSPGRRSNRSARHARRPREPPWRAPRRCGRSDRGPLDNAGGRHQSSGLQASEQRRHRRLRQAGQFADSPSGQLPVLEQQTQHHLVVDLPKQPRGIRAALPGGGVGTRPIGARPRHAWLLGGPGLLGHGEDPVRLHATHCGVRPTSTSSTACVLACPEPNDAMAGASSACTSLVPISIRTASGRTDRT